MWLNILLYTLGNPTEELNPLIKPSPNESALFKNTSSPDKSALNNPPNTRIVVSNNDIGSDLLFLISKFSFIYQLNNNT